MTKKAFLTVFIPVALGAGMLNMSSVHAERGTPTGLSTTESGTTSKATSPSTDQSDSSLIPVSSESMSDKGKKPKAATVRPSPKVPAKKPVFERLAD